jgi:hypothetical protein
MTCWSSWARSGGAQRQKISSCSDGVGGFGRISSFGIENRRPSAVLSGGKLAASEKSGCCSRCELGGPREGLLAAAGLWFVDRHPKTYRQASKRPGDEELRARLRELGSQRRRVGYRRLGNAVKREGINRNRNKLYRLQGGAALCASAGTASGPQVRGCRWQSRRIGTFSGRWRTRGWRSARSRPSCGRRPHLGMSRPGGRQLAHRFAGRAEFDRIVETRGCSRMVVSDHGTEFTSNAILDWQGQHDVEWYDIAPGKTTNGSPRDSTACCATSASTKPVCQSERDASDHRSMETRLQYQPTAHEPR